MKFPDKITIGDKYGPAMSITSQQEADEYFEACVQHNLRRCEMANMQMDRQEAEKVERINLGYYAGYYNLETQERVERLFRCAHPIFGSIAENDRPSFEKALTSGIALAQQP